MATYIRYAHKAEKLTIDLGSARDRVLLGKRITAVTIWDKGAGSFTLHFQFFDGTEFTMDDGEVANKDRFAWDIEELRITNTAQAGYTLKLLIEMQVQRAG